MSFRPHLFGRYTILDPIAIGGMAEIFRARLTNTGDAPDRILIIKKIITSLSNSQDFVEMFEGEIKITVGLSHPNIVQIFDYGRVDGCSFLAMEYVEGKNLRQFLKRLISMKSMFSIDMSCYIVSQVSNALAYAHAFKDRMSGEHLAIVHRDVSPQNVMISYDGSVKLFDFGIAKAKSASEATQAGVIKGKPSYLSPEQITGEVLDGRSDVFSLGIVLWEMLTAKRLFVADNDMAILRMIQSAKIEPPSTYNPAIPQALDAIALRALARDRDKRYRTGEELQRDLHRFLYSYNPGFNPADLSYYATELFKKEIHEDRERLRTALKLPPDPGPAGSEPKEPDGKRPVVARSTEKSSNASFTEGLLTSTEFNREVMEDMLVTKKSSNQKADGSEIDIAPIQPRPKTEPTAKSRGTPSVTARGTKATRANEDLVLPPWANEAKNNPTKKLGTTNFNEAVVERKVKFRPGSRSIAVSREIDDQNRSPSQMPMLFGALVILLLAPVLGARFFPETVGGVFVDTPLAFIIGEPKRAPANIPSPKPKPSLPQPGAEPIAKPLPVNSPDSTNGQPNTGRIRIKGNDEGYQVSVNGKSVPLVESEFNVPFGIDLIIEVSKPGYDSKLIEMKVTSQETQILNIELSHIEKGYLTFFTNPGADVTLKSAGRKSVSTFTPLRKFELPTGEYEALIENTRIKHQSTVKFRIEKGKLTTIEKDL
jgi:serine/threonine protein kinase